MKKAFLILLALLMFMLFFGCSLGGKAYHLADDDGCWEIKTNDADLVDVLELLDYTKGECPASFQKKGKGCEYDYDVYDSTMKYYFKDSEAAEIKAACDLLGGDVI